MGDATDVGMRLGAMLRRLAVPPSPWRLNPDNDRIVGNLTRGVGEGALVLNLGSGSSGRELGVVNLDIKPFDGVGVCASGECLPFRDGSFAGVLMRGVFEHVEHPQAVLDEVKRVLRSGGFLYVEVPFLQPYHASPLDYRRFTLHGLRSFLTGFQETRSGVQIGPGSTLAWVIREATASILAFGSPFLYRKALALVGWLTFWLRGLDRLVVERDYVANSASALYYVGVKAPEGIETGA
jgi:SAM-dependent methyltransferase